jgi:hypothetical protein
VRDLGEGGNRKAYERKEIADTQISSKFAPSAGIFKVPYLFGVLGLKDEI